MRMGSGRFKRPSPIARMHIDLAGDETPKRRFIAGQIATGGWDYPPSFPFVMPPRLCGGVAPSLASGAAGSGSVTTRPLIVSCVEICWELVIIQPSSVCVQVSRDTEWPTRRPFLPVSGLVTMHSMESRIKAVATLPCCEAPVTRVEGLIDLAESNRALTLKRISPKSTSLPLRLVSTKSCEK